MKKIRIVALRSYQVFSHLLFDPIQLAHRLVETPALISNLVRYARRQGAADASFRLGLRYIYPVLGDRMRKPAVRRAITFIRRSGPLA